MKVKILTDRLGRYNVGDELEAGLNKQLDRIISILIENGEAEEVKPEVKPEPKKKVGTVKRVVKKLTKKSKKK